MQVIEHEAPKLNRPTFLCDGELHGKLNDTPLLKNMNKSFSCMIIGKPQSGKTSFFTSLLQMKSGKKHKCKASFHKVFDDCFVFMPSTSRQSMKDSPYEGMDEDRLLESVTVESLEDVYTQLLDNKENKKRTLLIFDDVQSYLKINEIEQRLLHIISNRRHLLTCVVILAQNYNKIPKNIRITITDTFIFNPSRPELKNMEDEIVDVHESQFKQLVSYYRKIRKADLYAFIYIHDKNTFFVNWNEVTFEEEDDDE